MRAVSDTADEGEDHREDHALRDGLANREDAEKYEEDGAGGHAHEGVAANRRLELGRTGGVGDEGLAVGGNPGVAVEGGRLVVGFRPVLLRDVRLALLERLASGKGGAGELLALKCQVREHQHLPIHALQVVVQLLVDVHGPSSGAFMV